MDKKTLKKIQAVRARADKAEAAVEALQVALAELEAHVDALAAVETAK